MFELLVISCMANVMTVFISNGGQYASDVVYAGLGPGEM